MSVFRKQLLTESDKIYKKLDYKTCGYNLLIISKFFVLFNLEVLFVRVLGKSVNLIVYLCLL